MAEFGRKFSFKGARPDDNDLHMIVAETESREDAATQLNHGMEFQSDVGSVMRKVDNFDAASCFSGLTSTLITR